MHTAVSLSPNGPGMLAFRHRGFDQDNPAWDLHMRAAILGYEITGRDDSDTNTSVGAWKEDADTRGDLNCANYWQADYDKRKVGCWGFGYAAVIQETQDAVQGSTGPSLYGNSDQTQTGMKKSKVLPIGQEGKADKRFKPKNPIFLQPEDEAGDDPDSPNGGMHDDGNGDGGANGGEDPNGVTDLGNGWVYQDGVIAYVGPSPNVDSLSGFNGGYWSGGFNQFTYGGSNSTSALTGIPGVGFSSGFPGFSGVNNTFTNGGSIGFSFSNGNGRPR